MEPYYRDDHCTIYHGDCRDVLPEVDYDIVVTDPPYGIGWHQDESEDRGNGQRWGKFHAGIANDEDTEVRDDVLAQLDPIAAKVVFGAPLKPPPDGTKQVLVWQKPLSSGFFGVPNGFRADWEAIYLMGAWPNRPNTRSAVLQTTGLPYATDHPHAKPVALLRELMALMPEGAVIDPFMGGGSTLVAARDMHRQSIGIEVEEQYCELAATRLAQGILF